MRLTSAVRRVASEPKYHAHTIKISGDSDFLNLLTGDTYPPCIEIGSHKILVNDGSKINLLNVLCREKFPENNFPTPTIFFSRTTESPNTLYFPQTKTSVGENGVWRTVIDEKFCESLYTLLETIIDVLHLKIESYGFNFDVGMSTFKYYNFLSLEEYANNPHEKNPVMTCISFLLFNFRQKNCESLPEVGTKVYVHWQDPGVNSKMMAKNLEYAEKNNIHVIKYTKYSQHPDCIYVADDDFSPIIDKIKKYFDENFPRTSIFIDDPKLANWLSNNTNNISLNGRNFPFTTTYSVGTHLLAVVQKKRDLGRYDCKTLYYSLCPHHIKNLDFANPLEENFFVGNFISSGPIHRLVKNICNSLEIPGEFFPVKFGNRNYTFHRKRQRSAAELDEETYDRSEKIYLVLTDWSKTRAYKNKSDAKKYVEDFGGIIKKISYVTKAE